MNVLKLKNVVRVAAWVLVALAVGFLRAEYIYWGLDDSIDLGGSLVLIKEVPVTSAATAKGITGVTTARIAMTTTDADNQKVVTYLEMYNGNGQSTGSTKLGLTEIAEEGTVAFGPAFAAVPSASGSGTLPASAQFMIELGAYNGSDWEVLAVSQAMSYTDLSAANSIVSLPLSVQGGTAWSGGAYAVPEPSGALLLLLGGSLLALRRRRRAVEA